MQYAIGQIARQRGALSIRDLSEQMGISHKHLIALFHEEVGLSPKRFCRIRRFQGVLEAIEHSGRVDWADLACACGYYDQAHFIREFRDFAGMNPSAYLHGRGDYARFIPLPTDTAHAARRAR